MNDDRKTELAIKQLDHLYNIIQADGDRSFTIRRWCLAVLIASIIALKSFPGIQFSVLDALLLPCLTIGPFWMLDGFQCAFICLHQKRARQLETIIANEKYDDLDLEDYFHYLGYDKITHKEKLEAMLHCLFKSETVWVFYGILTVSTILFLILFLVVI